jgi:hypothetical protein
MNLSLALPHLTRLHLRSAYMEDYRRSRWSTLRAQDQRDKTRNAIIHSLQYFMLKHVRIEGAQALPDIYVDDQWCTFVGAG